MADRLEVSVCTLTFMIATTITRSVLDAKSARHCSLLWATVAVMYVLHCYLS